MAVYGMRDLLAGQRMKTAAFNLVISSMFARSEAINRGSSIYIKAPSGDDLTGGWCVLISSTASCDISNPDLANTMRVSQPVGGVTYTFRTAAGPIVFNRAGRLDSRVKVEIVDDQDSNLKRCVAIDVGGNATSVVGACT
jgi:Tfp pilus assembly protein FimT